MYDVIARAFASHQCDLGSNRGVNTIRGLSLLLVLSAFLLVGFFTICLSRKCFVIDLTSRRLKSSATIRTL